MIYCDINKITSVIEPTDVTYLQASYHFRILNKNQNSKFIEKYIYLQNLGYNIALFILPRLKYFKKKGKTGIPCCFLPDNFHLLKDEEQTTAEEKGVKEMNDALDEMIFAFEYIIDGDKFCELPESLSFKGKDFDFNSEKTIEEKESWKQYMEKANELNDRKNNGLLLFAKYYDTLWI